MHSFMYHYTYFLRHPILYFYIFAVLVDILFVLIEFTDGRYVSKALLMPLLLIFIVQYNEYNNPELKKWHVFALIFSFIGDMVLQIGYFIPGLIAFLMAHIFYIYLFIQLRSKFKSKSEFILAIIICILGVLLGKWMAMGNDELLIPVIIYSITILFMGFQALKISTWTSPLFLGALCFIMSDFILAHGMFKYKIPYNGFWVMITYCLAQYWIGIGLAKGMVYPKR
jgi:uncharacterized membrane protein YhhN